MKIYVGNLHYHMSESQLRSLFSRHGAVQDIWMARTRSGDPRCFGFVHMEQKDAEAAIAALDGFELEGRPIVVNRARAEIQGE